MKQKIPYVFGAIFSLFFLTVISILTFIMVINLKQRDNIPPSADTVYVYVNAEQKTESETLVSSNVWFVKKYNEKIGIFDNNGALLKVIDVYVKTLPKKDQTELQEGFWIDSDKELYSIIEAYSD